MKSRIFEKIKEAKAERVVAIQNRNEYLAAFKAATKESDVAFDHMAFCRTQMIHARRDRYRVRGEVNKGIRPPEDLEIANAVYNTALANYQREDADFQQKFQEKRAAGDLYYYWKAEVERLSKEIQDGYKKLPKKSTKKPPTKNNKTDE